MLINRQLEAENATLKAQVKTGETIKQEGIGNDATALWLNSQLKDAKSQLFDLRHQVQNYSIELRAINDKRDLER